MQLDIADAPAGGRSGWLAERLRHAIADGRLPVGSRLPASRVLAAELRVSRGVVTEAYQRLTEDGHVAGRGRGGTVVVAAPPTAPGPPPPPRQAAPAAVFGAEPDAGVFDALRAARARIDLSPGVPDLAAFPRTAWLRAERTVLASLSASDLGYGDPRGAPALRRAVAVWLARTRGFRADPDEVLIVAGVAQALGLLARALRVDGVTEIAVEDPGSLGARQHLWHSGFTTPPVPVDGHGVVVEELRACGAPVVLLTPAHQFPTGVVLGGERRRELMRWAGAGGLVVEDDYDAEHRYDRPPVPALRAVLPEEVCYTGSVSKLLAPALRVGWVVAPSRYRDALIEAKRFADLGNAVLPQLVLAELMESGQLERQLRFLRRRHHRRRDAMIAAIRTHLPDATVHGAAAGLHLMITFTGGPPDTDLAAAALSRGVKTQPLSWHRTTPGPPGLVLGYAASTPTDIAAGVATLAAARRAMTTRAASTPPPGPPSSPGPPRHDHPRAAYRAVPRSPSGGSCGRGGAAPSVMSP
ncbi:GntR family transcriptional regulator/MocR family aminotransferase [Sphaerisporangium rubeum]|uniref:GntR family transcriptional regulator/MocR family aminotransferase n=1 Tax=Sphaerisporangium rubeum TaxID=321317 RepID=A0A7X0IEY2_9ACTN|nr:PLP-dependent aminotransferase family protein [Sphaerisporangium rubeum]MBB6473911.1 GntR family transcriptional regulator/MocR family aminotransferase [Sphaerisporangium rubeum]